MKVNYALGRRLALAALVVGLLAAASGCGGGNSERASNLRPPVQVNVAVEIGDKRVSVSPTKIGAGPLRVIVSNQSSASSRLSIDGPRLRQSVGPINPQDTATLEVDVNPGQYKLSADGTAGVRPAVLTVGPKRPSAQNQLLLP